MKKNAEENSETPKEQAGLRAPARLRLHVLASGSKGNCSIVEDTATGSCVAIDCGITWKAFRERSASCGVDLARIRAFLVTHEHTDHTKGLGVVTRGLAKMGINPVLYASRLVQNASAELQAIQDAVDLRSFAEGDALALEDISALPFHTSHDAAESFGFRLECGSDSIGFMTDTGIVTEEASEALQRCRMLAIEANHDPDMLASGPYPAYLKARVGGQRGHLSNEQSATLLETLLDDKLETVVGMHVSQNNNDYRLPVQALSSVLEREGLPAQAFVGYQDRPISV